MPLDARLRTRDLRVPVTQEEAQAQLDLADTKLGVLARLRAEEPRSALDPGRALGQSAWTEKRAELVVLLARLRAGEAPLAGALADAHEETRRLREEVADLQQKLAEVRREGRRGHLAALQELQAALRKREATIDRLRGVAPVPSPPPGQELTRWHHLVFEAACLGLEAVEGLVEALSPREALCVERLHALLPEGYRAAWREGQIPHLDALLAAAEEAPEATAGP